MTTATPTDCTTRIIDALVARHGQTCRARAQAGVERVALRWRVDDGDDEAMQTFCLAHFVACPDRLNALIDRLEIAVEQIGGHLYEMGRTLRRWSDLRGEKMDEIDDILAMFDPAPDLSDQYYRQHLAFVALLNLDRPDLNRMLAEGETWTARDWAAARICQTFGPRIPSDVADMARTLGHKADTFVSEFHVPVGTVVDKDGRRPFDADRTLVAHWLIREEIRSGYTREHGVESQRALMWVMRRHIDGTIPRRIMDGCDDGDWDTRANTIGGEDPGELVGLERYERWIDMFHVAQAYDEHHPEHPTAIRRKCELGREIPVEGVERLLLDLLEAPARHDLTRLVQRRVGRPLEAFDIYFDQLAEPKATDELDAMVHARFGDHRGLQLALPEVLTGLGYSEGDAAFLGSRVQVEIARGAGHAMRPRLPGYNAWLRTNSLEKTLGWDGFDTAMHELGHNLEQLCSEFYVPRSALRGVPNTACTEAFAFLYQAMAPRVLGLDEDDETAMDVTTCETMLAACQIAGCALLEIRVWQWLYDNPDADAEHLRTRVLELADELWAAHYAELLGDDHYATLAAYQHMIGYPLYLADYPLGHIMSHQIRRHVQTRDLATETRRICSIGRLTPDAWMQRAVGTGISAKALADDAGEACTRLLAR